MAKSEQAIVVGVTGKGQNTDALRYAAREASMTSRAVILVHAPESMLPPLPPSLLITNDILVEAGASVAQEVRDEFEEISQGSVPVDIRVLPGDPGRLLGEMSGDAALLVLQHRSLSALHRLFTGSTVATAVAHAQCPVVSVPAGHDGPEKGLVVAGLLEDGGPRAVAEAAFREADHRQDSLRLVHGWRLAPDYDHFLAQDGLWQEALRTSLDSVASDLSQKYPGIEIEVNVEHDWPADVLVAASREADLLVLGRHSGSGLFAPRLGARARAVVAHAECPVMVVPV